MIRPGLRKPCQVKAVGVRAAMYRQPLMARAETATADVGLSVGKQQHTLPSRDMLFQRLKFRGVDLGLFAEGNFDRVEGSIHQCQPFREAMSQRVVRMRGNPSARA